MAVQADDAGGLGHHDMQIVTDQQHAAAQFVADVGDEMIKRRLSRHIHTLQKYRDDTAKELGYKYNPERIKRDDEKHVEGTREIYSAQSLGERPSDPIIHRRNYLPKHWDNPPEPLA